jgi:hypothetical protein
LEEICEGHGKNQVGGIKIYAAGNLGQKYAKYIVLSTVFFSICRQYESPSAD